MGTEGGPGAGHVGPVTRQQLLDLIGGGRVETVILAELDHIGRLFGKRVEGRAFAAAPDAGMLTCSINYAWDVRQTHADGVEYAGWHTGYHDMWGRPDWSTARIVPWAQKTAMVICDTCSEQGDEVAVAPRTILRRQLDKADALGFRCQMASELEFHVYCYTPAEARAKGYRDLHPSSPAFQDYSIGLQSPDEPFLAAVRRQLTDAGIPVECSKGEYGWGQTEVNLAHADALEAADRHVLYKLGVKELAREHGRLVTFMALPDAAGPTPTASSCHIHLSLWDGAADSPAGAAPAPRNVFADPHDPSKPSELMRHFLGGLMHCIPDLMPLYAPYINSYKRLRAEDFSPCTNAWGYDYRSAAFRMVGHGGSMRIENRVPGADVNPYLAYAAMVGSGLYGVEHGLEPGPFAAANARELASAERLPGDLPQALARFLHSDLAARILSPEVVRHLARFYELEVEQYFGVVTDWERHTYFEGA
jgi:glutamine synthetase